MSLPLLSGGDRREEEREPIAPLLPAGRRHHRPPPRPLATLRPPGFVQVGHRRREQVVGTRRHLPFGAAVPCAEG